MSRNAYKNYRIAAFTAVNTGEILGCSANITFRAKCGGSGFVYDNSGRITHSVSAKTIRGKGSLSGFFCRNTGSIEHSGFVGAAPRGSGQTKATQFRDSVLRIDPSEPTEDIYRFLGLDRVWKNKSMDSLEPDFAANFAEAESAAPHIMIKDADTLLSIIDKINAGDPAACRGHYVLAKNINLGGKKIDPIGASESTPFSGIFDGSGKKVFNFTVDAKNREYAGFFGYTEHAVVVNLKLDYILKGTGGNVSGGMVGCCRGGRFENCAVFINLTPSICCGGFAGKNAGTLVNCYVCGKIKFPLPFWLLFPLCGVLVLLLFGLLLMAALKDSGDMPYTPEVIDPNQVPVVNNGPVTPPEAGTSRISFELNQVVYISAATQVGEIGYVNPARATQDVVIRICVSDGELVRAGYDLAAAGVRTAEEMAAPDYDPDSLYTELYRSGRIQIGYGVDNCKLSALPGGETLKEGEYDMVVMIDGYDPETNEKAIVTAQAPITVLIVP